MIEPTVYYKSQDIIDYINGFTWVKRDEPTERIVHTERGIQVRCAYCKRLCPSDEYECDSCGAPT